MTDAARSLTDRIRHAASARGVEPARIRRQLVFQRILARVAPTGDWVLKGGYCLEVRLGLGARATRDLDLAVAAGNSRSTAVDLQDALAAALEAPLDDGFTFHVGLPRPIAADEAGNPGWRTSVRARVGQVVFDEVRLDVVARADEIAAGTEPLTVPPPLPGTGFAPVVVPAVDVAQHAAEKAHAYARIYAHDRPSSRTKDLVDLVLLVESGLLTASAWAPRIRHVFRVRDGAEPPATLPMPPASWRDPYAAMALDLGVAASDTDAAWNFIDIAYRDALSIPENGTPAS